MKKNKNKNHGFTMVEILATIVILGLLSAVGTMTVSNIISKSHKEYFKSQENMVLLAGKEYYSDYRSKLPKTIGQVSQVTLETLIHEKYIKEVVDYRKNACNYTGSSVKVQKQGENEYSYSVFLKCDGYNGYENGSNPSIIYLPNSKKSNKDILVEMKVSDDNEVKAYSYVVYKNNAIIKTVSRTNYNKKIQIELTGDGSYKIVGTAWDNEENVTIKESGTYVIDATPPNCAQVKINSNLPSNKWTYKDIQFTFSNFPSDMESYDWLTNKDDSTCSPKKEATQLNTFYLQSNNKKNVTTKTLSGEGKRRGQLILYDAVGNSCKITTEEFWIDKTIPTVELKGSTPSGRVTNKNVELTAIPTPSCTRSDYTYVFEKRVGTTWQEVARQTTPKYTVQEEGKVTYRVTVETEAGRKGTSNTYDVNIDTTPPNCITVRFSPSETNGWSKNIVPVTVSPNNSDIVSYDILRNLNQSSFTTYSYNRTGNYSVQLSDEGTHILQVKAYDEAGNYCTTNSGSYKIDKTAPTCEIKVTSGTKGSEEWYKERNVTLTMMVKDKGSFPSEVEQYGLTTSKSAEYNDTLMVTQGNTSRNGQIWRGFVKDNAGNVGTCSINVKVDKSAPTCKTIPSHNGWTNQDVLLRGECTDNESGCVKDSTKTINYDTNSMIAPENVKDRAGNVGICQSVRVQRDTVSPTCESSGGSPDWRVFADLLGTCSDNTGGSGCSGNVPRHITEEMNSTTESPGTVYDNAGNSTVCPGNQTVRIDTKGPSKPVVTLKVNNDSGASYTSNTWTGQNVFHKVTSSDAGSGIAKYQYSHDGVNFNDSLKDWSYHENSNRTQIDYLINWGGSWTFYIRAVDNLGNVSPNSDPFVLKIDKTAPTVPSITNPSEGNWSKGNFALTVSSSDTASGLADWYYSYDQSAWTKYASSYGISPFTTTAFTAEHNGSVYIRACDKVGNCSQNSTPIKIDTTPPTTPSITNPSGGNWSPGNFSLTCTSSDAGSGLADWYYSYDQSDWKKYNNSYEKSPFTTSPFTAQRNQLAYIRVCDKVGNCSVNSTRIRIDTHKPTCKIVSTENGEEGVTYKAECEDKDGKVTTCAGKTINAEKGSRTYTRTNSITHKAVDRAGNEGQCQTLTVTKKRQKSTQYCSSTKTTYSNCSSTKGIKCSTTSTLAGYSCEDAALCSGTCHTCYNATTKYFCKKCDANEECTGYSWGSWTTVTSCTASTTVHCRDWYTGTLS